MTKSNPSLRIAEEHDWSQFHEFDKIVFPDDEVSEEFFMRRITLDGFYLLEAEAEIIGELIVSPFAESEGYLGRIGISPLYQGRGLGNYLMNEAMEFFRSRNLSPIHLYTQDHNDRAQGLYRKFGFKRVATTWQYFVPFDTLAPRKTMMCEKIAKEEIALVSEKYASLPAPQIERFLDYEEHLVFTLKDEVGTLLGACRFTPTFPGCFPFEVDDAKYMDDFLFGLIPFSLPEYDYFRITFVDNHELANMCDERKYKLHHRLYKMVTEGL